MEEKMNKKTDFLNAYTSVSDELAYLLTEIELSSKRKVILNQLSISELQQLATLTEEIAKSYGFKIEHQISFLIMQVYYQRLKLLHIIISLIYQLF